MIYKKIAKLAKEYNRIGIYKMQKSEDSYQQWVFAGYGLYDCSELPPITFGRFCAMFDFPEKVKKDMTDMSESAAFLCGAAHSALGISEYKELNVFSTFVGDTELKLFAAADNYDVFAFVRAADLTPIEETKYTRYSLARGAKGDVLLIVYEGLYLIAIIKPYQISVPEIEIWRENVTRIDCCFTLIQRRIIEGMPQDEIEQPALDEDGEEDAE